MTATLRLVTRMLSPGRLALPVHPVPRAAAGADQHRPLIAPADRCQPVADARLIDGDMPPQGQFVLALPLFDAMDHVECVARQGRPGGTRALRSPILGCTPIIIQV